MKITDNNELSRLEIEIDGRMAFVTYKRRDKVMYLLHTEVPDRLAGHGVGKELVKSVFEFIRDNGFILRPVCPFVNYYLRSHPQWESIVDPQYRSKSLGAIKMAIPERSRSIGNIPIGRILPFRKKRMVGPFIYLDRMGPVDFSVGDGLDVPPHPHIGLVTLTYLLEGAIRHRDSTGAVQDILPGEVNVMTAGKGVVHSERTPEKVRRSAHRLWGLQFWISLPVHAENVSPDFQHYGVEKQHIWAEYGVELTLIAGNVGNRRSPVETHSPLFLCHAKTSSSGKIVLDENYVGERACYVLKGSIEVYGERYRAGNLVLINPDKDIALFLTIETEVIVFGGLPFEQERYIWWNFVHTNSDKIEQAKRWYAEEGVRSVPDETEGVPLPVK